MKTAVVEVAQLDFGYTPKKPVLQNVSFNLSPGETVGLLGPNGAGKTTLIKLLVGLISPTAGNVRVLSANPYSNPKVREKLGVMHQSPGFDQMLTGWDNLLIAGRFFAMSTNDVRSQVKHLEECLGPFDYFSQPIISLSGGQRKRLQIVRALLNQPAILILDEPTVALDVEGRYNFYDALHTLLEEKKITTLWTTHYLEEVKRNCERTIIIANGRLLIDSPTELLNRTSVQPNVVLTFDPDDANKLPKEILETNKIIKTSEIDYEIKNIDQERFFKCVLPRLSELNLLPKKIVSQEPSFEEIYLSITSPKRQVVR